ncbi:MAG: hypothetical protein ACRCZI_02625 [Cetobacterium sp.]
MIIYREKVNEDKKIYNYLDSSNKKITDKKILEYISSLPAIPPAYNDVEIFYEKSPKILFQGTDAKGRLQQIYSPKWRAHADKNKFKALIEFGKKLPKMTLDMHNHIKSPGLTKNKLISIILLITRRCGFRVGSMKYQKLYGSIGLITLTPNYIHFRKSGKELHISFPGKKGVINECIIDDELLIKEITKLMAGKAKNDLLFSYIDPITREKAVITAIDINNWLKEYGKLFTSKFFRNFSVNDKFIEIVRTINSKKMSEAQRKRKVNEVIKELSASINNTPTICKKSYLDPNLIKTYIETPKKYYEIVDKDNLPPLQAYVKFLEHIH